MCLYNDHCDHQCVLSRLSGLWDNILLQTRCRKRGVKIQMTRTPSATPIWCVVQLVRTRRIRVWCCSSPAGLSPCSLWPLRSPTRTWLCRPAHANSHAVRATVVLKWMNELVHSYTYRSYRTWCFYSCCQNCASYMKKTFMHVHAVLYSGTYRVAYVLSCLLQYCIYM